MNAVDTGAAVDAGTADRAGPGADAARGPAAEASTRAPRSASAMRAPGVVAVVGALLSIALTVVLLKVHDDNEDRLLRQRTLEAAAVLSVAVPGIESSLVGAAEFAEATNGADVDGFRRLTEPIIERGTPYVASSLWDVDVTPADLLMQVGEPLRISELDSVERDAFFERARVNEGLSVLPLLDGASPRLGYAYTSTVDVARFVVYAEAAVTGRTPRPPTPGSAFDGLHNAIYLGTERDPELVLSTDSEDLPLGGRTSSQVVEFGDTSLLLVMSPEGVLGGSFFATLPWLVGAVTLAATVAAAVMTARLAQRRRAAERLAVENASLYRRQRGVSLALQRAILPERLPDVDGVDLSARYVAGVDDLEVGGDFYDVFVDGDRLVAIIGDVSGRGVEAATVMAKARFAFQALASRGDAPSAILRGLAQLIDVQADGHFATVVCGALHVTDRRATFANAGHPDPILVVDGTATAVTTVVGLPLGVDRSASYPDATIDVPAHAAILMFTDGLFERRGETIDDGLARLTGCAAGEFADVDELVDRVVRSQRDGATNDDIAILGVAWTT